MAARAGLLRAALGLGLALAWSGAVLAETEQSDVAADQPNAVERGQQIFWAGGCTACHTDRANGGPLLAGGRALKTGFGTFFTPNITPDTETGIGAWSDADFLRAMREGVAPDGHHYYPAFPYTSYAKARRQDLLDLKAYLFSLPPVRRPNRAHELRFPFGWRALLGVWKLLFFDSGAFVPDPARPVEIDRGAYLVTALGHCGECHTARNFLGGFKRGKALAGTPKGPEGTLVPNITPDSETGIGAWSVTDLVFFFRTGFAPGGDDAQGPMREAIDDGLRHLSQEDLEAIAGYLLAQPPQRNQIGKPKAAREDFELDEW